MRLCKPHPTEPNTVVPIEWTVRYMIELDNGLVSTFNWTYNFACEDKHRRAGDALLASRYAERAVMHDGVIYPPHRIRQITWEVL